MSNYKIEFPEIQIKGDVEVELKVSIDEYNKIFDAFTKRNQIPLLKLTILSNGDKAIMKFSNFLHPGDD